MSENNKLRVLHIIASINPAHGGPTQALLQTLLSLGNEQHIETVCLDSPNADWIKDYPGIVHPMGSLFKKYGYTPKLTSWIREHAKRFDVAVVHGLWNHASVGGGLACKKANLPYVLFAHGMMGPWFKKTQPLKHFVKQIFWLLQGRVVQNAQEVLFTCDEEKRLATESFWGYTYTPRVVAFGAADGKKALLDKSYHQIYNAIPELNRKPYLLYLSRIHEIKGCDLLLEAFAQIKKSTDYYLIMAGPCDTDLIDRLKLQAKKMGIADRVFWPGMLKNDLKLSAFINAEAFILFSHHENFGIAVAEALSFGKPVLISNQVNIWREITTGNAGIASYDTVEGATEVLTKWESLSPEKKKEMSIAARCVYEQNFTVEMAAKDLTNALLKAVQSGREKNA